MDASTKSTEVLYIQHGFKISVTVQYLTKCEISLIHFIFSNVYVKCFAIKCCEVIMVPTSDRQNVHLHALQLNCKQR